MELAFRLAVMLVAYTTWYSFVSSLKATDSERAVALGVLGQAAQDKVKR